MCISPCAMLNRMIWMWKIGRKSIFVDSSERSQSEVIMKVVENAAAVFFCFFNLAPANENQNWSENEFFKNCLKFHSQLVCMSASLKQQKNVSLLFFHFDVITLTATRREEKYYSHTGKKHIVQLGQKREKNLKKREREKNYLFLQHAKRMTWINYVGNRSAQPHRAWLRRIQNLYRSTKRKAREIRSKGKLFRQHPLCLRVLHASFSAREVTPLKL